MIRFGLIKEGKIPADKRVALTPQQCKWIKKHFSEVDIVVQSSDKRCFSDREYQQAGIAVQDDLSHCDILFGIKEVPIHQLIENKTYLIFSHTKKKQPHNRLLLKSI